MHDLNRVLIVGRLTRDPELRALPSGASVCSLRIASNSSHKDPETGEWGDRPNYFDVSVFGTHGERVATYMRKGSRVGVDGRLAWREWEAEEDRKRQAVSIIADTVQFLERAGERHEAGDGELVGVGSGDGL